MDIGTVDIKTFGHLLEGDATRRELQEGLGLLERAQAATETEARAIEGSMDHAFRLGRGVTTADRHLLAIAAAKAEERVTSALANLRIWQITGEGQVDHLYLAEVQDLKEAAVKANENLDAAAARLQFNEKLDSYMRALDKLVAKARDIIPVEGGALPMACLLYKWAKEEFEAANEAFNKIAKTVGPRPSISPPSLLDADSLVAAKMGATSIGAMGEPVVPSASAAVNAASAPAPTFDEEEDLGYEVLEPDSDTDLVGADRDSPRHLGRPRHDEEHITDWPTSTGTVATRPNYTRSAEYERLLEDGYPLAPVTGRQMEVGLYAWTVQPSAQSSGTGTVYYEFSTRQVAQVLPPRHLNELEVVFQAMFGLSLAMLQTRRDVDLSYLEAEAEERRHREGRDPEVPGRVIWLGLLRQEVTTLHIRLLMAFLGHRELAMVKRGYATRSGAREDYAWVEFTTLAEARRVRYRYDDISHWGLTPWDDYRALAEAGFDDNDVNEDDVNAVLAPAQAQDQAPAPLQAPAEVTTTYRGRPAVIKDGYTYIIKSTVKRTTYWRCILCNKENCKATAKAGEGSTELTILNGHHSHDPDLIRMKARQIVVTVKQQARDRPQTSAATIVNEAMYGLDHEVALAINRDNLLRVANREKRSDGSGQLNRPLADIEWPEAFTVTAGNPAEPFLVYDSRLHEEEESVIFIFASPVQLQQLREHDHWSADGTFWCTPRLFEQLYTVHANIGHSSVPGAYILTVDRLQTTYERALRALVQHGGLQGVAPRTIMHDFELPAINAIKDVFPDSAIRLCLFHFAQAVWRNIADHGLTRLYKQNKKVRELLRSFVALALVPPADVVECLDLIVTELNRLLNVAREIPAEFDQGLRGFLEYFEKTYVHRLGRHQVGLAGARFKPALWNCYQAVLQGLHRSNNAVEGWHSEFNRTFHRAHMALDKFVQRLQMDENRNRQRLDRHEYYQADPLRNRRRAAYEEADKHILAIARKYATHYLPNGQVLRYLRCMQFHLSLAEFDQRGNRDGREEVDADGDDGHHGGNNGEAEAAGEDLADNADDDSIPLNESHPGQDSDDDAMDFEIPPPTSPRSARSGRRSS